MVIELRQRASRLVASRPLLVVGGLALAGALATVIAAIAGLVLGSAGKGEERYPFPMVDAAAAQLRDVFADGNLLAAAAPGTIKVQTALLPLQIREIRLPPATRAGTGGSIATLGDYVIVLSNEGQVSAIDADGALSRVAIELPDYGFDAYTETSRQPEYRGFNFDFYHHRYNDIAPFRDSAGSGLLVSYTRFHRDRACFTSTLSKAYFEGRAFDPSATGIDADDWETVFESRPCLKLAPELGAIAGNMAGGRLVVDVQEGAIYHSVGDYGWDGLSGSEAVDLRVDQAISQRPATHYGVVLRTDLETGETRRLSVGHRNVQGLAIDSDDRLWAVEHGPRFGDELNLIREDRNYGWPLESHGTGYSGLALPSSNSFGRHTEFEPPRFSWMNQTGPSDVLAVEDFHEAWDGDLLVSTLSGHRLVRLRLDDARVVYAEDIALVPGGTRYRAMTQRADGSLAIMTDGRKLLLVEPVRGGLAAELVERHIQEAIPGNAAFKQGVREAMRACTECHSLNPGDHRAGPSLARQFDHRIGSTVFAGYSPGMAAAQGSWDEETLARFIEDPASVVPGTSMPNPGVSDRRVREAIVDILAALERAEAEVE